MSIALRIVERPVDDDGYSDPWSAAPGDMWLCAVCSHRMKDRAPCWVIRLPDGAWVFHTNMKATDSDDLWDVEGDPPHITITPSIDVGPNVWHGHIVDGRMSPEIARRAS